MILVLYRRPETKEGLLPVPSSVVLHPMAEMAPLAMSRLGSFSAVLCEWDAAIAPAAAFAELFPDAYLATLVSRFGADALADSRQKGFAGQFVLPLPDNFFEEMEKVGPPAGAEGVLALSTQALELLEKQRDYTGICRFADEALRQSLPAAAWSVHLLDPENGWRTAFRSESWRVDEGRLSSLLSGLGRPGSPAAAGLPHPPPGDLAWAPLIKDGIFSGVVCCHAPEPASPPLLRLLQVAARFLGSAFHHIDVLLEKERLSFADALTGLFNCRYLRQFLINEIRRCSRYRKGFSILFIDIDWFKRVNDNHGHVAGSDTLVEIGRQFASMVRESDVVVRYGGDEFVIVLTETGPTAAQAIAERIRKSVAVHLFGQNQGRSISVTVSIGVAGYPEHGLTADELIRKADGAMYQAKSLQKNNVRVAG